MLFDREGEQRPGAQRPSCVRIPSTVTRRVTFESTKNSSEAMCTDEKAHYCTITTVFTSCIPPQKDLVFIRLKLGRDSTVWVTHLKLLFLK